MLLGIIHYIPYKQSQNLLLQGHLWQSHRLVRVPLLWQQSPVKLARGDVALDEAVELTELWSRISEQDFSQSYSSFTYFRARIDSVYCRCC